MDKETLRKTYLEKRKALTDEAWRVASDQLFEQVQGLENIIGGGPVHIFLPIAKFKEVDTWPIVRWLWARGISTMTSLTDTANNSLSHVWFDASTKFKESKWGIPEPLNAKPADPSICTVIFVPLLAADKYGNRIGYGKGFYDQFLALLPKDVVTVGLSLLPLLEEVVPTEAHDVALGFICTPGRR